MKITSNSGKLGGIQVVETHSIIDKCEYACLSYCWGKSVQENRTTSDCFPRLLDLEKLPKTIADAIQLCHALGYQYIWVDSLCIIQGNTEDWRRESSRMRDIYGRSSLTISTSICDDSTQSFIDQRKPTSCFPGPKFRLNRTDQLSRPRRSLWIYHWREKIDIPLWSFEKSWEEFNYKFSGIINPNDWMGRGWTFQEWLLPPRVLHIDEITLWDCFEGYGNEMTQRQIGPAKLQRDLLGIESNISWTDIVENFTKRQLTKDHDRLPALAGIARLYQQKTRYTYLAGLWVQEIPATLLWRRIKGAKSRRNSLAHPDGHVPSWSWAALETLI